MRVLVVDDPPSMVNAVKVALQVMRLSQVMRYLQVMRFLFSHLRSLPLRFASPVVLALLLVGCASTLKTEVTSFHQLSGGLVGQRFAVTPSEEQKGSLEFDTYADFVRQALIGKGLVDAGSERGADLGVAIMYSVSGGASSTTSGTGGFAGFGWGSGGFSTGSVGIGLGFPIGTVGGGSGNDTVVYRRSLQVAIDRLPKSSAAAPSGASPTDGARIYEARAVSDGPAASLAPVMRTMVQAIFEDFPGPNAKTRVVRVPFDESM